MNARLSYFVKRKQPIINKKLVQIIQQLETQERLKASMLYSIEAGGKRLRPILSFAAYEAFSSESDRVLDVACALEMIHTYSLIHDDLPAMDDDNFRRGKLTNHKQFDDATAILAGDGLLTESFNVVANSSLYTDEEKVFLIKELSKASGAKGMVSGQMLDMEGENKRLSLEELELIHQRKTGELLRFAIISGAYLGGATRNQLDLLEKFSYHFGLIFQVQDDILDIIGDEQQLGKPVGSDENNEKSTYPKLLGLDGAIKQKAKYMEIATQELKEAGVETSILGLFIDYIGNRNF